MSLTQRGHYIHTLLYITKSIDHTNIIGSVWPEVRRYTLKGKQVSFPFRHSQHTPRGKH